MTNTTVDSELFLELGWLGGPGAVRATGKSRRPHADMSQRVAGFDPRGAESATVAPMDEAADVTGIGSIPPTAQAGPSPSVMLIAFEHTRWGPARLPKPLSEAGFRVATLCPVKSVVGKSRYIEQKFELPESRSSRRLEAALADAMRAFRPMLIIPTDEQVVAWLQSLVRRAHTRARPNSGRGLLDTGMLATLEASLGQSSRYDAMLLKSETLKLAAEVGVRTPRSATIEDPADAIEVAEGIGFPMYVKTSFSWAGAGVRHCPDTEALSEMMSQSRPARFGWLRHMAKHIADRDWYPMDTAIDLQQAIEGAPAMYTVAVHKGRVLAGFAGFALQTQSATGPSTIVRIGPHAEMAEASARLAKAMGATGFISFDFMIEAKTGKAYLLECNPRPIQIGHLGPRIGIDLCAALSRAMRGEVAPQADAVNQTTVAMFPQEWLRSPATIAGLDAPLDVPWDDPELLRAMVSTV